MSSQAINCKNHQSPRYMLRFTESNAHTQCINRNSKSILALITRSIQEQTHQENE